MGRGEEGWGEGGRREEEGRREKGRRGGEDRKGRREGRGREGARGREMRTEAWGGDGEEGGREGEGGEVLETRCCVWAQSHTGWKTVIRGDTRSRCHLCHIHRHLREQYCFDCIRRRIHLCFKSLDGKK